MLELYFERLGILPLGVTGNTPDSGSGESWFDPRRGNSQRDATMSRVALRCFSPSVIVSVIVSPDTISTSLDVARVFAVLRASVSRRASGAGDSVADYSR